MAKTFPADKGFEANALAVQVHGGYGYTSEYLPEAWLRDQKLNSIREGTSGIQALDLLGRKVMGQGGGALLALRDEVEAALGRARASGVAPEWCDRLAGAMAALGAVTMHLGEVGAGGDVERTLRHSADYLELVAVIVVAWQWLSQAAAARAALAAGRGPRAFYEGKLCAAQYWMNTELTRVGQLAALCRTGDDSYARMQPDWF